MIRDEVIGMAADPISLDMLVYFKSWIIKSSSCIVWVLDLDM